MEKIHFLMVLQTHSLSNNAGTKERYCKANKTEVMRRCTRSLIESINYAADLLPDVEFELKVFDDHSDAAAIEKLKVNLNIARFKTDLEFLETQGIMPSILACYEYGKAQGQDWVYFIQDDYLYELTAIYDMFCIAMQTSIHLAQYTCVFPYNDPYRYAPVNTVIQSHIIQAQGRHWRTQIMTGSCFMVHHSVLVREWDLFDAMGNHPVSSDMEDKTINQLFRSRGYYLFVPIPSIALHMQYEEEKDPFIDWREWWDRYDTQDEPQIDQSKNNLLHIGFSGRSIKEDQRYTDLHSYNEITLDIDKKYNPDIVGDIKDLSFIPSASFDCIFTKHTLEHVDYFSVPEVLKEFKRLLKPGGFARIVVPNIKVVAMYLVQDKMLDTIYESNSGPVTALDILYSQKYYTRKNPYDFAFHKMGFTKNIVKKIAEDYDLDLEAKEIGMDLIITLRNQ